MIIEKINKGLNFFMTVAVVFSFLACKHAVQKKQVVQKQWKQPVERTYHYENAKLWLAQNEKDSAKKNIVWAVNRTDAAHFAKMDSVIVPNDLSGDLVSYLPFPLHVPGISQVNKIIFFSYPAQVFAAYENGELVYTGPVNMGRKNDPTPIGLYYTNWKAEKTTSTFNDEWDLRWNFNIENDKGIGFHQYDLPGYPASHSCLRLQENDARYLYAWADQWVLDDKKNVSLNGTAVVVFGTYNFDAPKPWLQLIADPKALDITAAKLEELSTPYLNDIMQWQEKRVAADVK